MPSTNAPLPTPPSSPDSLDKGLRGKITGVTRIGPRAAGLGAIVLFLVFALILVGANRPSKPRAGAAGDSNVAFAAPAPQDTGHFGANVPIVDPASHTTQSAPETGKKGPDVPAGLVLTTPPDANDAAAQNGVTNGAPNAVPNIATGAASNAAQPAQLQVAAAPVDPVAEAKLERARAAEQARTEKAAERAQELELANQAPAVISAGDGGAHPAAPSNVVAQDANVGSVVNAAAANSPMVPSASAPAAGAAAPGAGGNAAGANSNAFLSGPFGQYAHGASLQQGGTANASDYLDAQRYAARSKFEIVASSVIPAELITGIDSEQPGLISAQVRQDVFDSRTGRYLLVPKGSRLIGVYKNDVQPGQSRILVAWERLIFPDTSSIDLHEQVGADTEGYSGLGGKTDDHFASVFTTALLSSILSAGLQLSQPQTGTTVAGTVVPSAGQLLAGAAGQQIAQVGAQIAQKQLSLPPVIHVPRGYPFLVVVDHDMVFPGPYQGAAQ